MDKLLAVLAVLATNLPALIAEIVLLSLALLRRDRHPRVSTLAACGAGLLLFEGVLSATSILIPFKLQEQGLSTTQTGMVLGAFGLAQSVLFATGLGLIVGAVFAERGDRRAN